MIIAAYDQYKSPEFATENWINIQEIDFTSLTNYSFSRIIVRCLVISLLINQDIFFYDYKARLLYVHATGHTKRR